MCFSGFSDGWTERMKNVHGDFLFAMKVTGSVDWVKQWGTNWRNIVKMAKGENWHSWIVTFYVCWDEDSLGQCWCQLFSEDLRPMTKLSSQRWSAVTHSYLLPIGGFRHKKKKNPGWWEEWKTTVIDERFIGFQRSLFYREWWVNFPILHTRLHRDGTQRFLSYKQKVLEVLSYKEYLHLDLYLSRELYTATEWCDNC